MIVEYDRRRAFELLCRGVGRADATFRPRQEEAIRHVVEGRGRLLLVQKTGWGKSFVYFIATKLLREAGTGPALLISPLLALMRNQVAMARRMGVRAETINSSNNEDWEEVRDAVLRDEVDILLVSPERLGNEEFRETILGPIAGRIQLLVIDEAHCISDWGHDFRPDYRRVRRLIDLLPSSTRLLATTATANQRVMDDLEEILGPGLAVMRGDLVRRSLVLQTIRMPRKEVRLAWLAHTLPRLPGTGIIYTLTVADAREVAAWLVSRGLNVAAYTGQDESEERREMETALAENRVKALVATSALGMGYDKPDLSFVIHYQAPGSVVGYYQQVGRAGRALDRAWGILLGGEEDEDITEYFIETAFPTPEEVQEVLDALDAASGGLTIGGLEAQVNLKRGRLQQALKLLSLESPAPIARDGSRWFRTPRAAPGPEFWNRVKRLTELRYRERDEMQAYLDLPFGAHMGFLVRVLGGAPRNVPPPPGDPLPVETPREMIIEAERFLRQQYLPILPRSSWPSGGLSVYRVRGRIPEELRFLEGRALCRWAGAGWGRLVRDGKFREGVFSEELVDACIEMYRGWAPGPAPEWVTCIPSLRHPELVPDFARRFAAHLGLPFLPVIEKARETAEQKKMQNSIQQARNLDGAFRIASKPPSGPVLLIDDMVDSRWTLTIAGWLLRSEGSGPVLPLVLADARSG